MKVVTIQPVKKRHVVRRALEEALDDLKHRRAVTLKDCLARPRQQEVFRSLRRRPRP